MKKVILLGLICLSAPLFGQTIPDLTQDELAKYVLTLAGSDIGNVCFSDSVFTKIGDITIHIRQTDDCSNFWYQKYALDIMKERFNVDKSDDLLFEDIKPYTFTGYRDAQIRYSEFVNKRVKGISQYSKFKANVEQLLSKVSSAGGVEKLFMLSSFNSPVYFTSYKKTLTPYLQAISTSLMNIRKSQDSRILHILQEQMIPMLSSFHGTFDNSIKYYGLSYTYVSDNLSGDDFNAQGETISIIAPAQVVAKYKALSITQEELLKACELFYVNSRNKEVRKISYDSLSK